MIGQWLFLELWPALSDRPVAGNSGGAFQGCYDLSISADNGGACKPIYPDMENSSDDSNGRRFQTHCILKRAGRDATF